MKVNHSYKSDINLKKILFVKTKSIIQGMYLLNLNRIFLENGLINLKKKKKNLRQLSKFRMKAKRKNISIV